MTHTVQTHIISCYVKYLFHRSEQSWLLRSVRKRVNLESRAWNLRLSSVKRNQYIQRLCADGVQLIFLNN